MSEQRTNLGQGVLFASYTAGSGTMTVTPASAPRGPFPSSGVFSIEVIPSGSTAGALYTVSAVGTSGGNQVLTVALESGSPGADVNLASGTTIVEVETVRSLVALIVQESAGGGGAAYRYEWIPAAINQFLTQTVVGFGLASTSAANLNLPVSGNQLFATGLMGQSTNFLFGRRIPNGWDGSTITFDLDCIIDGGTGNATLTGYLGPAVVGALANPVTWGAGVSVTVVAPNIAGGLVRFSFALNSSACVAGEFIFVAILRGADAFAGNLYPLGGLFGIKY